MDRNTLSLLSARHRAILAAGVRGGDGSGEPTPAERVAELHELLASDDNRARLSDEEVAGIDAELCELWRAVRAGEVESIDRHDTEALRSITDCRIALCAESARRFDAAADAQARIDEMAAEAGLGEAAPAGSPGEAAAGAEAPEGEGEGGEEPAEPGEGEGAEEGAQESEAGVQAGSRPLPTLAELNRRTPRARRDTIPAQAADADAVVRWLPNGNLITRAELAQAISEYPDNLTTGLEVGRKVVLAQVPTLPQGAPMINSRQDSPEVISRKLEQAVGSAMDPRSWDERGEPRESLLASGGWGAPSPVAYDIPTIAVADRPVMAGLATVGVDRGSLTWVRPPTLADVVTGGPGNTGAAVGIWTAARDANPGQVVKSAQHVGTPVPVTVSLDSLYMTIEEGVLQARAFPEFVAAWTTNTQAAWARMAETFLLDKIEGSSITKYVTQADVLSATRDALAHIVQLAAAERHRQRQRGDTPLRLFYPTLLDDLVQIDLVRSGTNFVDSSPLLVARSYISTQLRAANINATPYLDSSTVGGQLTPAQSNIHDLNNLNRTMRFYLFHEGAFVRGDGGTLNIGIIRDKDLVSTNDFRVFSESFEAVFDRGFNGFTLDLDLCPTGSASSGVDIQHLCTTGS